MGNIEEKVRGYDRYGDIDEEAEENEMVAIDKCDQGMKK